MTMKELSFGHIRGGQSGFDLSMGASEVIKALSGRFVKNDGSGRGEVAGDGHTTLMGFVQSGDLTCSATEAGTKLKCITDVTAVFRIPMAYDGSTYTVNYSTAIDGTKHDLVVVSNIQKANITDASEGTIIVVGGKAASSATADDGYIDCMLNPETMWS